MKKKTQGRGSPFDARISARCPKKLKDDAFEAIKAIGVTKSLFVAVALGEFLTRLPYCGFYTFGDERYIKFPGRYRKLVRRLAREAITRREQGHGVNIVY